MASADMNQSGSNKYYRRMAGAKQKIRQFEHFVWSIAPSFAHPFLRRMKTVALRVWRRGSLTGGASEVIRSLRRATRSAGGVRRARETDDFTHRALHEQNEARAELRRQVLEILCTAGTLKECTTHGSHFLGSGDLAAAYKAAAAVLSRTGDATPIQKRKIFSETVMPVYEEISRSYRCDTCYRELKARLAGY
jgi:hypothetical protein